VGSRFEEPTWLVLSVGAAVTSKRSIAALFTAALGIRVGLRVGEDRLGPDYAAFYAKVAGTWLFRVLERFSALTDAVEDLLTGGVTSIVLVATAFGDLPAPCAFQV
jgi:hypothetical protein